MPRWGLLAVLLAVGPPRAADGQCASGQLRASLDDFVLLQYQKDRFNTLRTVFGVNMTGCAIACIDEGTNCKAANYRTGLAVGQCNLKSRSTPQASTYFDTNWAYLRRTGDPCTTTAAADTTPASPTGGEPPANPGVVPQPGGDNGHDPAGDNTAVNDTATDEGGTDDAPDATTSEPGVTSAPTDVETTEGAAGSSTNSDVGSGEGAAADRGDPSNAGSSTRPGKKGKKDGANRSAVGKKGKSSNSRKSNKKGTDSKKGTKSGSWTGHQRADSVGSIGIVGTLSGLVMATGTVVVLRRLRQRAGYKAITEEGQPEVDSFEYAV